MLRSLLIRNTRSKTTISSIQPTHPRVTRLYNGLVGQDPIIRRTSLASAITLIETKHTEKRKQAEQLLTKLLQNQTKSAFRIGLTGPPGAGKSTYIEALGNYLTGEKGLNVAVLAIDPSSTKTGGSLLGDKTRMEELSRNPKAFIRPTPSGGTLGGVARTTFESCLLCESAGYDVILVETVGVGQSEYKVADLVDMFTLIIPPAGGDELQGIKRGIIEVVDAIVVNKADGDLLPAARRIQMEYLSALKYLPPNYPKFIWKPPVVRVSSIPTGSDLYTESICQSWSMIERFFEKLSTSDILEQKRVQQRQLWMWHHVQDRLLQEMKNRDFALNMQQEVALNKITPGAAAEEIIDHFLNHDLKH